MVVVAALEDVVAGSEADVEGVVVVVVVVDDCSVVVGSTVLLTQAVTARESTAMMATARNK